eukprot:gene21568-18805_t
MRAKLLPVQITLCDDAVRSGCDGFEYRMRERIVYNKGGVDRPLQAPPPECSSPPTLGAITTRRSGRK